MNKTIKARSTGEAGEAGGKLAVRSEVLGTLAARELRVVAAGACNHGSTGSSNTVLTFHASC